MNNIVFQHYHTSCGEPGCCDDYGVRVYVNSKEIGQYCNEEDALSDILKEFNIDVEISTEYEGFED
ncbi:hypothetical protein D3C87_624560 [compost metagenome]